VSLLKQNRQKEKEINEQLTKIAQSVMFLIKPEKIKKNRSFDYALPVF